MQVRVITMRYQEGIQGFPEDALRAATFGKTVLDVRESAFGRHAPGAARVHRAPEHPRRQRKSPRREGAPRASGKEIRFSVCAAVRGRP